MSLLGWLGKPEQQVNVKPTQKPKKVDPRSLSPLMIYRSEPERLVLGVLGTRSNIRYEELDAQILGPLVEAWGNPDEIVLSAEGDSSAAIQGWAERHKIPVSLVSSDWKTQGRRAGLLRDARIQRDSTHLLLLQGPRSNALSTLGLRLSRKGRPVVISERPGQEIRPAGQTINESSA
jgi:hypothetical protein